MTLKQPLKGRIHSFETFGTVDGPGIRFIVFFQGCLMRCLYCHNRDTWDLKGGEEITVDQLMKEIISYKNFITPTGGVTASGGEAILQTEFVKEWFTACKKEGMHTCLDTNGFVRHYDEMIDALMDVTDLVMLDIKQPNDDSHQRLTGVSNSRILTFARYLQQRNQPTWIRYVVVPSWTDDDPSAHALGQFLQGMTNVEKVELLPYHKLGKHKWETLGEKYQLEGIDPPPKETLERIKQILQEYGLNVQC